MACTDNIVTIRDYCGGEETTSLSGYDLMDAPEISISGLAQMANEKYVSGLSLARKTLSRAILQVKNDFIGVLSANRISVDLVNPIYDSSEFQPGTNKVANGNARGLVVERSKSVRGRLKKLRITNVQFFPFTTKSSVALQLTDMREDGSGDIITYNIDLTANMINTVFLNYEIKGVKAKIVILDGDVNMSSSKLLCSCDGTLPAGIGNTYGLDGTTVVKKEGFGINVQFQYYCDYEQLICDMSHSYLGELIYLKARYFLLEEHLRTGRFTNWVIYNREETEKVRVEIDNEYSEKWNILVKSLFSLLSGFRDECLNCRGISIKVNR